MIICLSVLYCTVRPVSVRTFNSRGYGHRRSFCLLFCSAAVTYVGSVPMERTYVLINVGVRLGTGWWLFIYEMHVFKWEAVM